MNNGDADARAGSGIWYAIGRYENRAIRLPSDLEQSNQTGELTAILETVNQVSPFAPLHIKTDSEYVKKGLTEHLEEWENRGWIGVNNRKIFIPLVAKLRARGAPTTLEWVKGHSGDMGNENADEQANTGAQKGVPDIIDLTIPDRFNLTGAQLASTTQSIAYQGIRESAKKPNHTPSTITHLEMTKSAVKTHFRRLPTETRIWKALRDREVTRKIRDFLWKVMLNVYNVGHYWTHIEGYEDRAICTVCNTEESMEHILTKCKAKGQKELWKLAGKVWRKKYPQWPAPTIGTILGCTMADFRNNANKRQPGANRLYKILVSETAYLIWVLRCQRVIEWENSKTHTINELTNRWHHMINQRLLMDQVMTKRNFEKKALSSQVVLSTWNGVIQDQQDLPENWINTAGVLVGVG